MERRDAKVTRVRLMQLTEEENGRHTTSASQASRVKTPKSSREQRMTTRSRPSLVVYRDTIEGAITPASINTAPDLCDPIPGYHEDSQSLDPRVEVNQSHVSTYPPEGGCLPHVRQRLYGQRVLLNENKKQRSLRLQRERNYHCSNKKTLKIMAPGLCNPKPHFHEESKPLDPNTHSYRSAYAGGDKALVYPPEGGCLPNVSQRLYGHRVLLNETEEEQRKRLKREMKYRNMNSKRESKMRGAPRPATPLIDIYLPQSQVPLPTAINSLID